MKVRTIITLTLFGLTVQACGMFGGGDEAEQADPAADAAAPEAPAPVDSPPSNPDVAPLPAEAPSTVQSDNEPQLSRSPDPIEGEMPYQPQMTGVIDPGMSSAQVIATWGEPAQQRSYGNHTFMYYRNGCENTCGTFDLVILEGDQVIDAVVRGWGHDYSGVSSSPPNTPAVANAPAN